MLLVGLSAFTLFSYRNALLLLAEERREEATRLAQALAAEVERTGGGTEGLRRLAPTVRGLGVLDPTGQPRSSAF